MVFAGSACVTTDSEIVHWESAHSSVKVFGPLLQLGQTHKSNPFMVEAPSVSLNSSMSFTNSGGPAHVEWNQFLQLSHETVLAVELSSICSEHILQTQVLDSFPASTSGVAHEGHTPLIKLA